MRRLIHERHPAGAQALQILAAKCSVSRQREFASWFAAQGGLETGQTVVTHLQQIQLFQCR